MHVLYSQQFTTNSAAAHQAAAARERAGMGSGTYEEAGDAAIEDILSVEGGRGSKRLRNGTRGGPPKQSKIGIQDGGGQWYFRDGIKVRGQCPPTVLCPPQQQSTSMQLTQCFRPTGISQSRRTRAHREGSVGSLQGPAAWKTEQGGEEKKGEEETGKGKDLILG